MCKAFTETAQFENYTPLSDITHTNVKIRHIAPLS